MSSTTTFSAGSIPRRADNVEIAPRISEDWLSLIVGLLIFALALAGIANVDLLGWGVTTSVWTDVGKALAPVSKAYASLGGAGAILATYVALLVILSVTVFALKSDLKRFALAFTAVFWIAYACWIVGSYANFAAVTPADMQKFGVNWSLKLTNEGGYIFALIAGLIIANFLPRFAESIKAAIRPELYIKIAIVILGGFVAVTAASKLNLASSLLLRGVAAIVEAYLIYWAVVYFVARKWFGFNREWAAPLASGISICGVAASIATGSAIRAKPAIPVLVSSLVVIFAVVEVLILPFLAQTFLWHEPLVAGAWIGLAVKTDGAAVAALAAKAAIEFGALKDSWNGYSVLHSVASRVGALDLGVRGCERRVRLFELRAARGWDRGACAVAHRDIVGDRRREQERFLRRVPDLRAQ